ASVRTGDLFASGTISGPEHGQEGSFIELWKGERFLEDGDEVVLRYSAPSVSGGRLSLGEVSGRIEAAR
ncbi:MAG: fumarylacetoacetate hydrolase family protein, partial [Nocardioides sp.]|nr:fumarylacetoacetate hydrolase family protein [Nocardioides sp.]